MIGRSGPSRSRSPALRILAVFAIGSGIVTAAALACGPGDLSDLTSGNGDAAVEAADLCPLRALPPPPPSSDVDSVSIPGINFAIDDLRIETSQSPTTLPKPTGIDLDHTCCNVGEPPSCIAPPDAAASACQPDGSDNNAGNLLAGLTNLVPGLSPTYIHDRIHQGVFSLLLGLGDWNGKDDDPKVALMARTSTGLNRPDGAISTPHFDGNDVWDVDPTTLAGGANLTGSDCNKLPCVGQLATSAYVSGGYVVATFDQIPIAIVVAGNGSLTLPFTGATVIAKISKDDRGLYHASGEIDGRLPADRLLAASNVLSVLQSGLQLCQNKQLYDLFRSGLCSAVDVAANPSDDRKPGVRCGAVSESATFTATPAKLGIVRAVDQPPSTCPDQDTSCP